jgi:hypothetical protein
MFWHPVRDADLEACLEIEPGHMGAELVGRQRALDAWRWLLRSPAFNGAVFEAEHPTQSRRRVVGIGTSAFVLSSFADDEVANPRPGLNARLISSIVERRPVVLTYEQLREGNTHSGLQLVVLTAACAVQAVSPDQLPEFFAFMSSIFDRHHAGYRIVRILYEAIGELELKVHAATGVSRIVRHFGSDRALYSITRESSMAMTGSVVSNIFIERRPVLGIGQAEQQLLLAALDELTDEELGQQLNLHVGTVKKRWIRIFDRVAHVFPSLFSNNHSASDEHARGKQKRHRVLAYVREHPEELRPYETDDLVGSSAES